MPAPKQLSFSETVRNNPTGAVTQRITHTPSVITRTEGPTRHVITPSSRTNDLDNLLVLSGLADIDVSPTSSGRTR